LAIGRLLCI